MMTGVGIVMPVFGRRMGELGGGVEELGLMLLAFAAAQLVMAPIAGRLADRVGRRPLILGGLLSFVVTNLLYLVAPSTTAVIVLRGIGGGLTAGMVPAALAMVGDVSPPAALGRWTGLVMGSFGAGFVLGPALGGLLYDSWGFAAPFVFSAALGMVALVAAWVLVPETLPDREDGSLASEAAAAFRWRDLSQAWRSLGAVLFLEFVPTFAFAFVEPEMVFHVYDTLGLSTLAFGGIVGVYGIVMVAGQVGLGQLGDQWGRKLTILLGLLLTMAFYFAMPLFTSLPMLIVIAALGGFGQALAMPAVGAWLLDLTNDANRSFISGLGSSAASLGGVLGPAAIVVVSSTLGTTGVFFAAAGCLLVGVVLVGALYLLGDGPGASAPPLDAAPHVTG